MAPKKRVTRKKVTKRKAVKRKAAKKKVVKRLTAVQKKALLRKKKKAELEKKTKAALKAVDSLVKKLKKGIAKDFGRVRIKYKEGIIVKKMRKDAAAGLRLIAKAIEGKKRKR